MKKLLSSLALMLILCSAHAQSCYWVFLTDKNGTTFDPYSYFDAKAIERYQRSHADLYDISNYPLNSGYVDQINAIATEEVGQSRWFNAIAVMATDDQIVQIEALPFVQYTDLIASDMQIAEYRKSGFVRSESTIQASNLDTQNTESTITDQLLRMQGDRFVAKGIDGNGIRIAVFDGGFHAVDTHQAFKHLRNSGRIISTWDFTKKREFVYDNHTHGTMVLSCIAGKLGDKQLGLATGASFLLAKTEVEPEPFKEEVWWSQAVEWADKNGADIINSSLGYGKDRHYPWEMDGRSHVAKAANMAASKGILVCNSAGNEGDDRSWKCIVTPADASDILTVGGINPSLTSYSHISFSSYGPTADGRMKPNVCNYGYCEVADPHNNQETEFAYGTSFSSPLTAGFCACAWQLLRDKKPDLTAKEMKEYIEQSGDLYPYYDYAFGYGVPQASYFLDEFRQILEPAATFFFEERGDYVIIHPNQTQKKVQNSYNIDNKNISASNQTKEDVVLFKIQNRKGRIERYVNLGMEHLDDEMCIAIPKASIFGYILVAHVNGFTNSYKLSKIDSMLYATNDHTFEYYVIDTAGYFKDEFTEHGNRTLADNRVSEWGVGQKYLPEVYFQYGIQWFFNNDPMKYSDALNIGFRVMRHFKKWYALGLGLDVAINDFSYQPGTANRWDTQLLMAGNDFSNAESKNFEMTSVNLELFQRIRFLTGGGLRNKGLHWDIGIYGGVLVNDYRIFYNQNQHPDICASENVSYSDLTGVGNFNWGITTRLVWDWIGAYARYRFSQSELELPQFQLGFQISF